MGGGWSSSQAAAFRRSFVDGVPAAAEGEAAGGPDPAGVEVDVRHDDGPVAARDRRVVRSRHCWVLMPDEEPMPGVVASWRRDVSGGWEARVAYLLDDGTGTVVTGWLPASCLRAYAV
ncbi:hypothetical protein [Pseudokineococcus sp. 1T1Z-3]|uniref:hypothetical protein n=1 Tax=Pseudokineococcus sp. 1T1Z-3 TaxID=3132745 RepID=UPI0030A11DE4